MFNIDKCEKRDFTIGQNLNLLKNIDTSAIMSFTYAGTKYTAYFYIAGKPFTEVFNGKLKNRKGFIMCLIAPVIPEQKVAIISAGYAVCSDKDEWNTRKGMVNAFVDGIQRLSYYDKKFTIDLFLPDIWNQIPIMGFGGKI